MVPTQGIALIALATTRAYFFHFPLFFRSAKSYAINSSELTSISFLLIGMPYGDLRNARVIGWFGAPAENQSQLTRLLEHYVNKVPWPFIYFFAWRYFFPCDVSMEVEPSIFSITVVTAYPVTLTSPTSSNSRSIRNMQIIDDPC